MVVVGVLLLTAVTTLVLFKWALNYLKGLLGKEINTLVKERALLAQDRVFLEAGLLEMVKTQLLAQNEHMKATREKYITRLLLDRAQDPAWVKGFEDGRKNAHLN